MFFILCDTWKTLLFKKVYRCPEIVLSAMLLLSLKPVHCKNPYFMLYHRNNNMVQTVPLPIWHHLFFEFWLVNTWIFTHWSHQRAVTGLENVCQLNVRRGKKLGFQLSQKHPRCWYQSSKIKLNVLLDFRNWFYFSKASRFFFTNKIFFINNIFLYK